MKRTKIRTAGISDTAELKRDIQKLVRDVVILRDKGCIFRRLRGHICSGYANDGHLVLQADHLITRSNSATYADTRLIVCVCQGIHGWKSVGGNLRKAEYDQLLKTILSPEIVRLWEACEAESVHPHPMRATDRKLQIVALKAERAAQERHLEIKY